MSKREIYEQKTEELIMPLIEQHQFELVDVEYVKEGGNWYLRAYIDKPGGITVDDCELVSRALSDLLDEHDINYGMSAIPEESMLTSILLPLLITMSMILSRMRTFSK